MNNFMDHTHTDAFVDWPLPRVTQDSKGFKVCPVCRGHGGWNLQLNAYPLHSRENTSENRHTFSHFRCGCSHCNGWGKVPESVTCSGHEWKWIKNTGRCLNVYQCVHCGQKQEVDSSD